MPKFAVTGYVPFEEENEPKPFHTFSRGTQSAGRRGQRVGGVPLPGILSLPAVTSLPRSAGPWEVSARFVWKVSCSRMWSCHQGLVP